MFIYLYLKRRHTEELIIAMYNIVKIDDDLGLQGLCSKRMMLYFSKLFCPINLD